MINILEMLDGISQYKITNSTLSYICYYKKFTK